MSDYIKREDAERETLVWLNEVFGVQSIDEDIGIFRRLKELPSADVVEVVRCEGCKWYIPISENYGKCTYRTREHLLNEPNDYCSYGERKDDE